MVVDDRAAFDEELSGVVYGTGTIAVVRVIAVDDFVIAYRATFDEKLTPVGVVDRAVAKYTQATDYPLTAAREN